MAEAWPNGVRWFCRRNPTLGLFMHSPSFNTIPYRDRAAAGRWLAKELQTLRSAEDLVVLGIPRGGLIVAAEVARLLRAPLDVFVVRKIRIGGEEPHQIGAMASGGVCVLNQEVLQTTEAEALRIAEAIAEMRDLVLEEENRFRQSRPATPLEDRNVVLVDDGAATGGSLRAAIAALRSLSPASITVALPVASPEASKQLSDEAEDLVCPFVPDPFYSIGLAYERFPRVSEELASNSLESVRQGAYLNSPYTKSPYSDGQR
ncbi:phosphoribosyl transferase [Opitutaceae bacterium EW11]|nr:phosphoribosyl transferase [Opitutaceae bacterium EW11]